MRRAAIIAFIATVSCCGIGYSANLSFWNGKSAGAFKYHNATVSSWDGFTLISPCDTCSGSTSWSHHFENLDLSIGPTCGCSDSATASKSLTLTSAVLSTDRSSDGNQSLKWTTMTQYASFAVDADVFDPSNGTLTFDWYPTTALSGGTLVQFEKDTSNRLRILESGTVSCSIYYVVGGTSYSLANLATHTANNWYRVTAKWKSNTSGTDMSITVCNLDVSTSTTSSCTTNSADRDYATMTQPDVGHIGSTNTSTVTAGYIDRVIVTKGDSGF